MDASILIGVRKYFCRASGQPVVYEAGEKRFCSVFRTARKKNSPMRKTGMIFSLRALEPLPNCLARVVDDQDVRRTKASRTISRRFASTGRIHGNPDPLEVGRRFRQSTRIFAPRCRHPCLGSARYLHGVILCSDRTRSSIELFAARGSNTASPTDEIFAPLRTSGQGKFVRQWCPRPKASDGRQCGAQFRRPHSLRQLRKSRPASNRHRHPVPAVARQ